MTTKTSVEAASANHNKAVASEAKNERPEPISLRVRTSVKAGFNFTQTVSKSSPTLNHNQTGIAVRSKVKAGRIISNHNQTAAILPNQSR
jgi:hypothetical protein